MLAKMRRKKWPWILGAGVIVLIIAVVFLVKSGRSGVSAEASNMSAAVSTGDLSTTVVGTGNLANDEAVDITIPSDLVIDEVLVKSGDYVTEGDALATIDAASIISKIDSVQGEIETLDGEIEDTKDDTESTTISAGVSGRIKKIYTAAGDSVSGIMADSGSLMVLSLDGLMAVTFETDMSVSVGDEVDVTLSDGSSVTGNVESVSGKTVVVTITDNGPEIDEAVTVYDGDGNTLGTGELYVNQPLTITGTSGTVKTVHVSGNEKVSSGKTLLTLKDTAVSAEYRQLVAERKALAETLQTLLVLSETNTLTATYSGAIQSVSLTDGGTTGSSSADAASGISADSESIDGAYTFLTGGDMTGGVTLLEAGSTVIDNLNNLTVDAPVTGEKPQSAIVEDFFYGKIEWSPAAGKFAAETVYTAKIVLTAKENYTFPDSSDDIDVTLSGAKITAKELGADKTTLTITARFTKTEKEAVDPVTTDDASSSSSAYGGSSTGTTGTYSGTTADTAASVDTTGDTSTVSTDEVTAFTISSDENMLVTITVDELDILSLEGGQTVDVTLDAIEGETFEGYISEINTTSSSEGGVTSYTADIIIAKTDSMLVGMSASATITIEEKTGVLMLPVDAVQEMGDMIFVYTEQDSDGNLSGEVEVETGISNGTYVEITSGLSEGDTVYYTPVASDTTDMEGFFFSADGGATAERSEMVFTEGEAPSGGGQMPAGGN